jgi:hypothetical protein
MVNVYIEEGFVISEVEINIVNFKVFHISGTSSLILGKGNFEKQSSHSKTNNGVGSAYGDGSYINMSPKNSTLYDGDYIDAYTDKEKEIIKEYEQDIGVPDSLYHQPPYYYDTPYTPHPYSNYINPFEYIDRKDDDHMEQRNDYGIKKKEDHKHDENDTESS